MFLLWGMVGVTTGGVAGRLAATAAGRKKMKVSMSIIQRIFQCSTGIPDSGAMLGTEGGDDRLTPILTAAAITHSVQGDHDIFENASNGFVQLHAFNHETSTGYLGHITIALFFDELNGCFQRRLQFGDRRFQPGNELQIRVCRHSLDLLIVGKLHFNGFPIGDP